MDADLRSRLMRERVLREQNALKIRRCDDLVRMAADWRATADIDNLERRRGAFSLRYLSGFQFEVDELELLAGRLKPVNTEVPEWSSASDYCWKNIFAPGQTGHCELDLHQAMHEGLDAVRNRVRERSQQNADSAANDLCEAAAHALEGVQLFIRHAGDAAERKLATAALPNRENLQKMMAACRHIEHHAPRDFQEGLQLLWLLIQATMAADHVGLICPGHLDRTLGHLEQTVDAERGVQLIEDLYFQINAFEGGGLAYGVMLGGRDESGADVSNAISRWSLEALRRTRLVYPTVGICWHAETPCELIDLGVELIADGLSNVAFFGDETIQKGLLSYGVPRHEACRYQNSTCVEITPSGASNVWVASPYFSLCATLNEELLAEAHHPAASFDDFLSNYQKRLSARISEAVDEQNRWRRERSEYGRKPLQSVFTRDCLARGRDIDDGGADYNWVECSFVGLANLVDSLVVIREEVYRQRTLTIAELAEILGRNYEGREALQQKFLNAYPKYGNADACADALIPPLVKFFAEECARYRMWPDDSAFIPGTFCWEMHQRLGAECGATPDGREAGFPFADGGGPAQGREKSGPTRAALSASSWDHHRLLGGFAFNMKFTKSLLRNADGKLALRELILTFLRRGGFETQINVLDPGTLHKALAHPAEYADLVVRIGGYTDYFTRLSPGMQQEVLRRTEYESF